MIKIEIQYKNIEEHSFLRAIFLETLFLKIFRFENIITSITIHYCNLY